jgi:putative aldouronate transport system substrate-binding protein
MKKLLATMLAFALAASCSAAFAAEYDPAVVALDGSLPIIKDASGFEPFRIVNNAAWNSFKDMNEKTISKQISADTGIPIEWIAIPDEGYGEKINLMLASRDLPDMFWKGIGEATVAQYSGQDVFLPTEDLLEKYVPRLKQIYKDHPDYAALTMYGDGHRYGFPYIEEMFGLTLTPGPFLINKAWLDKLGLGIPSNYDEFKTALMAFRDAGDLNGNGEADEIPYAVNFVANDGFSTVNSFYTLMAGFGEGVSYGDYYKYTKLDAQKKNVVFPILSQPFVDTLKYYRGLQEEGLLDMDGFSGDGDYTYKLRLDAAVLGAFTVWSPEGSIPVHDVIEQYVPLPRMEGPNGKMGVAVNRSEVWGISQGLITTACEYPEILACMVNYLLEPEMSVTTNWGADGESYQRRTDGVLGFHLDENGYAVLPEGYETWNDIRQNSTPVQGPVAVLNEYYDTVAEYTYDAVPILAEQRVNGKDEVLAEDTPLPPFMMSPEEQSSYSQIFPQIDNIIKSYVVSSILDGGIDENYAAFEQSLKDAGLEEMLKLEQQAYDRYLVTYDQYAAQ